jgi:hypothetical protein
VWRAKRIMEGDKSKFIRLLLTCWTEPRRQDKKDTRPDGATLTITLEKTGQMDKEVTTPVEYTDANPPPPPP